MATKYWDIDDFLAEEEPVSVACQQQCYNMAFLNNSAKGNDKDLLPGTKLDIPLWLAKRLSRTNDEKFIIIIPVIYRENFQKTLSADPTVINLREKTPYYYEIAMKLIPLIHDETLGDILSIVMSTRLKTIIKKSFCLKTEDSTSFIKKLTNMERKIFENGRENITSYKFWMDDTSDNAQLSNFTRLRKKLKVT